MTIADTKPATNDTPTKSETVTKLLSRKDGATLVDLTNATSWLPHSARAHLTGLRKKGITIKRGKRKCGATYWHIAQGDKA